MPPPTDHGDIGPVWYSFDLAHKRVQEGGWTHEVNSKVLPTSKDLTGVNMRLTAGTFRELHWHTADEWAIMLYGSARVTVMNPNGTMFIDEVGKGDLWLFPAGFPHSIQGLRPDGCEFLLVFDQGDFSEDGTFLFSETIAHTPRNILAKNFGLDKDTVAKLVKSPSLYIFPAGLPLSLAQDRAAIGGPGVESPIQYTFKMSGMAPTRKTPGGEVRIVDSRNFPATKNIAAALITLKRGALRELHWHPNASEWQFWLAGKGRMSVIMNEGRARTMDFNANDAGFVPRVATHYIENTGNTDAIFLEMLKADEFVDVSLNNWIRRVPPGTGNGAQEHWSGTDRENSFGKGTCDRGITRPATPDCVASAGTSVPEKPSSNPMFSGASPPRALLFRKRSGVGTSMKSPSASTGRVRFPLTSTTTPNFDGQTGSLGASSIAAWAGYASAGKTFRKIAASPRVFAEGNYASGTKSPDGREWNTFDQLYPSNHDKFGFVDQVGRRNLVQFRVGVEEEPTKKWKLKQAFEGYWLATADDNFYASSGAIAVPAHPGASRHIGNEVDLVAEYQLNSGLNFGFGYARLFAGQFLKTTTPGHDYSYPYAYFEYDFSKSGFHFPVRTNQKN